MSRLRRGRGGFLFEQERAACRRTPVSMPRPLAIGALLLVCAASALPARADETPSRPEGIVTLPDGRILVSDTRHNRLLIYDAVFANPREVTLPGLSVKDPAGLSLAGNAVLLADRGNHRILRIDPNDRSVVGIGAAALTEPTAAILDPRGRTIVSDTAKNQIVVLATDGTPALTFGAEGDKPGQFRGPRGLALVGDLLFVADSGNGRIQALRYNADGPTLTPVAERTLGDLDNPHDVVAVGDRLAVLDSGNARIRLYSATGNLITETTLPVLDPLRGASALAVGARDTLLIADTGNSRLLQIPASLDIPKRPTILEVHDTGARIRWDSPRTGKAELRYHLADAGTPYPTDSDDDVPVSSSGQAHDVTINGLDPGTRYLFRVTFPGLTVVPGPAGSRLYAFTTLPVPRLKTFVRLPVAVMVYLNVVNKDSLTPDAPPLPLEGDPRLQYYKDQIAKGVKFYWMNSRMNLWLDCEFFVVPERREVPDSEFVYWPLPFDQDWDKILAAKGKKRGDYAILVEIVGERRCDKDKKQYAYKTTGGGTWGVDYPAPGDPARSRFGGGGDTAWLFTHETHHAVDSIFEHSGYDEYLFNHPSPSIDSARKTGEHWDCNAYILRHWSDRQFEFCAYGTIETVVDGDQDGIPDDEPWLPFDEARLGSSPLTAASCGCGMTDMEAAMSRIWVDDTLPAPPDIYARYLDPDPTNPDMDGDSIPNALDPYPLCAASTRIRRATPTMDGRIADGEWEPWLSVAGADAAAGFDAKVYAHWDADALYFAFDLSRPIARLYVQVDALDDGWYLGGDNYYIPIGIADGKAALDAPGLHIVDASDPDQWPHDVRDKLDPAKFTVAGSGAGARYHIEVRIPRQPETGLHLHAGQQIGVGFYFLVREPDGWISAFEPYVLFEMELIAERWKGLPR